VQLLRLPSHNISTRSVPHLACDKERWDYASGERKYAKFSDRRNNLRYQRNLYTAVKCKR